jgi:hypothetical protein
MPKQDYPIKNRETATQFCNKLMAYVNSPDFVPFFVEGDFGKGSSDPQRKYYWKVIIKAQLAYFKNDILKLTTWIFKALRGGAIDETLIHQLNKLLYNNNKSSERLTSDLREKYHDKICEDMFHFCGVSIAKPNEIINQPKEAE